jgi:hypothetical protein
VRMTACDFGEKQTQRVSIDFGQHQ